MLNHILAALGLIPAAPAKVSEFEPVNKAYAAGLRAFHAETPLAANPYPCGMFKAMWANGWADASFGARG